jgi:hypothetical protein
MVVKLQTTKRGNHFVSIPKEYVENMGWGLDEIISLCPGENGVLRLIPFNGKMKRE